MARILRRLAVVAALATAVVVGGLPTAAFASSDSISGSVVTCCEWTYRSEIRSNVQYSVNYKPTNLIMNADGSGGYFQMQLTDYNYNPIGSKQTWTQTNVTKTVHTYGTLYNDFRLRVGTWQGGTDVGYSGTIYY